MTSGRRSLISVGNEDRADDAVLSRPRADACAACVGLDDRAAGDNILPHVVRVGRIFNDVQDFRACGFPFGGVGHRGVVAAQQSYLATATTSAGELLTFFAEAGLLQLAPDLGAPLSAVGATSSTGRLAFRASLPECHG